MSKSGGEAGLGRARRQPENQKLCSACCGQSSPAFLVWGMGKVSAREIVGAHGTEVLQSERTGSGGSGVLCVARIPDNPCYGSSKRRAHPAPRRFARWRESKHRRLFLKSQRCGSLRRVGAAEDFSRLIMRRPRPQLRVVGCTRFPLSCALQPRILLPLASLRGFRMTALVAGIRRLRVRSEKITPLHRNNRAV